jgi:hypothetical protein
MRAQLLRIKVPTVWVSAEALFEPLKNENESAGTAS